MSLSPTPHYLMLYGAALRDAHRYHEAVDELKLAAKGGNAAAMTDLATSYQFGMGVHQSMGKTLEWARKGAEAGDVDGMILVGIMYKNGLGGRPSDVEGWYRTTAGSGSTEEMNYVAGMYYLGRDVRQNYAEAARWSRKAADAGNAIAMYNLGYVYETGRGVPQSYAQAEAWYRKAAAAGNTAAMNNVGVMYEIGRGVPQSYAEAAAWYGKAADAGYARAMNNLGIMYQTGRGVPKNFATAAAWYRKAAAQNYDAATLNLGVLYEYGWGVEKNVNTAMNLYSQAARSRDPQVAAAAEKVANLLGGPTANRTPGVATGNGEPQNGAADLAGIMAVLLVLAALSQSGNNASPGYSDGQEQQQHQDNQHAINCAALDFGNFPQIMKDSQGCWY
ncbi:MAG TPA: SEL1-like repeat protein [Acidobacteriaceae bacterium]|nr:SEL1-like repeat protein [Acidobacteriaceae bacterium]